jgi:WD repeat-containing protein 19
MQHITTPKLHAQYAKAKEAEGDYKAAADAYEKAKDIDSVIRIMLNYLENPERAFQMVRETRSSNGAQLVATYCQKTGHIQSAIEFLLMAKRGEEAYKLAETKNHMDKYAMVLEESGLATLEEYLSIAVYFEEKQRWGEAGKYFASAQHFNKAVKYYLMAKDDRIMDAIDVIKQAEGTSQQEQLVRYVHQWIIGEGEDGAVKDKKYLFELCRAIGEYGEMEATSVLMAQQEQGMGQFAEAHNMLRDTYVELRGHKLKISNELKRNLRLLHSYLIAKSLGQAGDFETASRMLVRVAENISKFPTHIVKILTSTVVMCQKAGMKRSAYQYASMLMQPEYRNTVDKRVRPRIEALVRRPAKTEVEEKVTPCPICDFLLPETMLDCPQCKNDIPYCIDTGKHMVLADWTACPSCEFPALYTPFVKHVAAQKQCPMCHVEVKLSEIEKLSKEEAKTALNNLDQEEEEEDSEGSPPDYDEEMDEEEYLATRNEGPRQMF